MTKAVAKVEQTELAPVQELVQMALSPDVDVEKLERLIALQERGMERDARMSFIAALAGFQDGMPLLTKNKKAEIATRSGASYSYSYASLDRIAAEIRSLLTKFGLSYSWDSTTVDGMLTCTCTLRHSDGHEVTSSFTSPIEQQTKMSGAQATAATLTYARRQSLVSVLGLAIADEDTDARGTPSEPITKSQAADLASLIDEVGADKERFLTYLHVENLTDLAANRFEEAKNALEAKRA